MRGQRNPIGFIRTTAIGGLLFLLPLIVLGALIGQIVPIVLAVAESLKEFLPDFFKTANGFGLLMVIAIAVILLLCFVAGLVARWSFGRKLSVAFEKKLLLFFPRYAILKDQMADSIGGDQAKAQMKPVVVRFDEGLRIAFETESDETSERVAVYLPGSPDAWAGKVVLVNKDRVEPLNATFGDTVATCEQLGRGSAELLAKTGN